MTRSHCRSIKSLLIWVSSSPKPQGPIQQNLAQSFVWLGFKGPVWCPLLRGDNAIIIYRHLKIFFRTTGPGDYPLVTGVQVFQMKDHILFHGEIILTVKLHLQFLKSSSHEPAISPISSKLGTKHPWVKRIQI